MEQNLNNEVNVDVVENASEEVIRTASNGSIIPTLVVLGIGTAAVVAIGRILTKKNKTEKDDKTKKEPFWRRKKKDSDNEADIVDGEVVSEEEIE